MFDNARSLSTKVIASSTVTLAAVLGTFTLVQWFERSASMETQLFNEARELNATLEATLRHSMVENDTEALDAMVVRMGALDTTKRLMLYDATRQVARATDAAIVGKYPLGDETTQVEKTRKPLSVMAETPEGRPYMLAVTPLLAEKSCLECHDGTQVGEPLGFLALERWADEDVAALNRSRASVVGMNLLAVAILAWVLNRIIRRLLAPLAQLTGAAAAIARGDVAHELEYHSNDEIGAVADQFRGMMAYLRGLADVARSIRQGNLGVEVKAASNEDVLSHALAGVRTSLQELVDEMRHLTGAAAAGNLAERGDPGRFQGAYADVVSGVNLTLDSVIKPIHDASAVVQRISRGDIPPAITEKWPGDFNTLRDSINTCIASVNALVADTRVLAAAAVAGKLSTRADATKHQNDFRKIVQGVNDTLDAVIGPLGVAAAYVDRISRGDIPPAIKDSYSGDFNALKENLNRCIRAVKALVDDAGMLSRAAIAGELSTRAEAGRHQGDFRVIVEGVNRTLDAMVQPIQEAAAALEKVAARDLTARMHGDYRGEHAHIKDALNAAVGNLDKGFAAVAIAADQVAAGAGQIAQSSQALAQGAESQNGALEDVRAANAEVAEVTQKNGADAARARKMADQALAAAAEGSERMRRLGEAITRIKASSDQTARIVKTINEIAFQTNLLALNAAVEAARAGDAGRGFAVVAEEVRSLAQRSAASAQSTASLIEEAVRNAEHGVAVNMEVQKSLDAINAQARDVSLAMAGIVTSSEQQGRGIDRVSRALDSVNKVTRENAAGATEAASVSEELSGQAEEQRMLVESFKLTGAEGQKRGARPAASNGRAALHA